MAMKKTVTIGYVGTIPDAYHKITDYKMSTKTTTMLTVSIYPTKDIATNFPEKALDIIMVPVVMIVPCTDILNGLYKALKNLVYFQDAIDD